MALRDQPDQTNELIRHFPFNLKTTMKVWKMVTIVSL